MYKENVFMIKLVKFDKNDFSDYYRLVGNEKVMAMITERAIPQNEARIKFELILLNNSIHEAFGNFKVLDEHTNAFIGTALIRVKSIDAKKAEIGYMILPQFWGRGIGSRISKVLIKIAQEEVQLEYLEAIIDPSNVASRRILIKNGFVSKEFRDFDGLPGEILHLKLDR